MSEHLSGGIYIEELEAKTQVVPSVSTSTMAGVGFTPQGKTDEPIFVTSLPDAFAKLGGLTKKSFLMTELAAFFANGGSRSYVIRVVPSDATKASKAIQDAYVSQVAGATATAAQVVASIAETYVIADGLTVTVNPDSIGVQTATFNAKRAYRTGIGIGADPTVVGGGVSDTLTITADGGTAQVVTLTAGVTSLQSAIDQINAVLIGGSAFSSGGATFAGGGQLRIRSDRAGTGSSITIAAHATAVLLGGGAFAGTTTGPDIGACNVSNAAAVTAAEVVSVLDAVFNANLVLSLVGGKPAITRSVTGASHNIIVAGTAAGIIGFSLVLAAGTDGSGATSPVSRVGAINSVNVLYTGTISKAPIVPGSVTIAYTSTTAKVITDDGAGALTGHVDGSGTNTIDYETGAFSFKASAAPDDATSILVSWTQIFGTPEMVSKGVYGNKAKLRLKGDDNFFDYSTSAWTRFTAQVIQQDVDTGADVIQETFEELSLTDSDDAGWIPDVINDGSDLIQLPDWAGGIPKALSPQSVLAETVGTGNGTTKRFTHTMAALTVAKKSVTITALKESDSSLMTITDDGLGHLIGDVDGSGTNTINYTTGAIDVTFTAAVKNGNAAAADYHQMPAATSATYTFTGGSDGVAAVSRNEVSSPTLQATKRGMYALDKVDEIMSLIIPDFAGDVTVAGDQLDYAELRRDIFVLLCPPVGSSAQEAIDWFRIKLGRYSDFAALYWPWILVADPLRNNRPTAVPPLGHAAGVFAKTDRDRNVGKSPGGTSDGALSYLFGLEHSPDKGERDLVYQAKINPLIDSVQTGKCVWGVRTISNKSAWRYINARRLFQFIEKSIYNATHWIVFENNGPGLWVRIKLQIESFLSARFDDSYFAGATPAEAFFVICDNTNNSKASIEEGVVIVDVGISPNKPAEFCRFRFQQRLAA